MLSGPGPSKRSPFRFGECSAAASGSGRAEGRRLVRVHGGVRWVLFAAVVRLEYAEAAEVAEVLRQILERKADDRRTVTCALYPPGRKPEPGTVGSVQVEPATNSLVLQGEPGDVRAMRELAEHLDVALGRADHAM